MDPIGPHFGLLTSTASASQSSRALYQQLSSFRNHSRNFERLKEEVKALTDVLGSLYHTLEQNKLDLSVLELPVRRCGMACQEFAKIIEKRNAQPSFRDWFEISDMGMDVAGFTSLVARYKATIIIALGDANLRTTRVTADLLREYRAMIDITTSDLEDNLQNINSRIHDLKSERAAIADQAVSGRSDNEEERTSIQQCLNICVQATAHMHQVQLQSLADIVIPQVQARLRDTKRRLINKLRYEENTKSGKQDHQRIREHLESVERCLSVVEAANKDARRQVSVIENLSVGHDGFSVTIPATQDLVSSRSVAAGSRSTQIVGKISEATIQQLSHSIVTFKDTSVDNTKILAEWLRGQGKYELAEEIDEQETKLRDMSLGNVVIPISMNDVEALEDSDVASVRSVGSSSGSTASTLVNPTMLAGADEFVELLLQDEVLSQLFRIAFDRVSAVKIEIKLKKLLEQYAFDLDLEARHSLEREAFRLIKSRRGYIARRVRLQFDETERVKYADFDRLQKQVTKGKSMIERYLREREMAGSRGLNDSKHAIGVNESNESDQDEQSDSEQHSLDNLNQVKAFMTNSVAFSKLRKDFETFLLPELGDPAEELKDGMNARPLTTTWERLRLKVLEFSSLVQLLFRPKLSPNCQRITWICGCGDYLYADIQMSRISGATDLQNALRESAAMARERAYGRTSLSPSLPAQIHLASSSIPNSDFRLQNAASQPQNASGPPTSNLSTNPVTSNQSSHQGNRFLLLCISTSHAVTLEHLDTNGLQNDEYLFDKIRAVYDQARANDAWYMQTATIRSMCFKFGWLRQFVGTLNLGSPRTMDFVRFRLVPVGMMVQPWYFSSPSIPPEPEVKVKKTYHYQPCPLDDVDLTGLRESMMHSLLNPGPHLDNFWLDRFPKKLREGLVYRSGRAEENTGWGIRIVQGPNAALTAWLILVVTIAGGLLGIVYSVVCKDTGGGFGMASWVIAVLALTVRYLELKPRM